MFGKIRSFWKFLGPGLVTGAADDDPSGIATYSQTGALFGYGQLWAAPFSYPFMTAMQEMCGRIGMVTGDGLTGIIKKRYARSILWGAVALLLVANTINIGADIGAMAESIQLLAPIAFVPLLAALTIGMLALLVYVPYPSYARVLKYLSFALFAYVITGLLVERDWGVVLHATVVPHIEFTKAYVLNIAAFLGTTISPYLFFWQADEEVEEEIARGEVADMGSAPAQVSAREISDMRLDTATGMFVSNIVSFFIMLTVAATLGASGITSINTAADAAQALRPIAGEFAFVLFAIGILGTGLLAVPVLAGSVGYAIAEAAGWQKGLGKRFAEARGFYLMIAIVTIVGVLVNFSPVGSIKLLYYSAVLNGVLAPPLMILILMIGRDRSIMGAHANGTLSQTLGWIITVIMSLVGIATIASLSY